MTETTGPFVGTTEQIGALLSALGKAQAEIGGALAKTRTVGTGAYSFAYIELGAIMRAIVEPLAKHGLCFTQNIREGMLISIVGHEAGGMMISEAELAPVGKNIQDWGKAITYTRRYTVQAMLGIAAEDDTDGLGEGGVQMQGPAVTRKARQRRQKPAEEPQPQAPARGVPQRRTQAQKSADEARAREKEIVDQELTRLHDVLGADVYASVCRERPPTLRAAREAMEALRDLERKREEEPPEGEGRFYEEPPHKGGADDREPGEEG